MEDKQLTLFGQFDKHEKRKQKLLNELDRAIKDIQYIRGNINAYNDKYSPDSKSKAFSLSNDSGRTSIDYAAYYLGTLMFAISRDLQDSKNITQDTYMSKLVFDPYNVPSDRLSIYDIHRTTKSLERRLEALILPYKEDLNNHKSTNRAYTLLINSLNSASDAFRQASHEA